jgi:hypothetical protein
MSETTAHAGSDCYSSATGKSYTGIYGRLLADVPDFDVSVKTISATDSNLKNSETTAQILTYLKSYDMLVIGFDDMYQELGSNAADAIVSYIGTGRSVLFTHDTTSQANVPFADYYKRSDGYDAGLRRRPGLLGLLLQQDPARRGQPRPVRHPFVLSRPGGRRIRPFDHADQRAQKGGLLGRLPARQREEQDGGRDAGLHQLRPVPLRRQLRSRTCPSSRTITAAAARRPTSRSSTRARSRPIPTTSTPATSGAPTRK